MEITALGMIETSGLLSAIEAADAGLKAANVRLLGTDYVRGGLVMVRFEGDVAAVQAAVDAGASAAQRVGNLLSAHVIPRAMPEVFCMLASDPSVGPGKRSQGGCAACGGCEGGRREMACARRPQREKAPETADEEEGKAPESSGETSAGLPDVKAPGNSEERSISLPGADMLKTWRVTALRSFVRKLPGFPLTANEIRYANKQALLEAAEAWREGHRKA